MLKTVVEPFERELRVLDAAMPASMVAGVIAMRYGCDGAVALDMRRANFFF